MLNWLKLVHVVFWQNIVLDRLDISPNQPRRNHMYVLTSKWILLFFSIYCDTRCFLNEGCHKAVTQCLYRQGWDNWLRGKAELSWKFLNESLIFLIEKKLFLFFSFLHLHKMDFFCLPSSGSNNVLILLLIWLKKNESHLYLLIFST